MEVAHDELKLGALPMKTAVALIHIFFATVWLGSAFFYTVLLLPSLSALDPASQRVVLRALRRVATPLLALSALATIVSGLVMMVQQHAQHPGRLSGSRWGIALVVGALASLAALALATLIEVRLRRSGAAESRRTRPSVPGSERALRLVALMLLLVALATMAVARYS